jgi:hypothetical protein
LRLGHGYVDRENRTLERGLAKLQEILGAGWQVEPVSRPVPAGMSALTPGPPGEKLVVIQPPPSSGSPHAQVLVEARENLSPAQARNEFRAQVALMHSLVGRSAVLVVAPWLSPRTQQVLDELGYSYLDLTGNVSIRLQQPAVIVRLEGNRQNPYPSGRRSFQRLRGATAGQLVRVLIDAEPPFRATELALASGVSLSYVSRLLDALDDEALITRDGRLVRDVDWPQLIRTRASQHELLKANSYVPMLAQRGTGSVIERLRESRNQIAAVGRTAITGTYAVRAVVPDAASIGGQLMIQVLTASAFHAEGIVERIADELGLLRVDGGADVVLLAADRGVFERTRRLDGIDHVALSQLAIDSLSGTGRMPAEGDALVDFMATHVSEWRAPNLSRLGQWTA